MRPDMRRFGSRVRSLGEEAVDVQLWGCLGVCWQCRPMTSFLDRSSRAIGYVLAKREVVPHVSFVWRRLHGDCRKMTIVCILALRTGMTTTASHENSLLTLHKGRLWRERTKLLQGYLRNGKTAVETYTHCEAVQSLSMEH